MYFLYRLEMCNFMHYWSVCVYSVATGNTVDVNLHKYFLASAQHLCRKQALDEAHVQNYQGHLYFILLSNYCMSYNLLSCITPKDNLGSNHIFING